MAGMFADNPAPDSHRPRHDAPPALRLAAMAAALHGAGCGTLGDTALKVSDPVALATLAAGWQAGRTGQPQAADGAARADAAGASAEGAGRIAGSVLLDFWGSLPGDRSWLRLTRLHRPCGWTVFGWRCGALGISAVETAAAAYFVEAACQALEANGGSLSRETLLRKIPDQSRQLDATLIWSIFHEGGPSGIAATV